MQEFFYGAGAFCAFLAAIGTALSEVDGFWRTPDFKSKSSLEKVQSWAAAFKHAALILGAAFALLALTIGASS
ncbi:MAG: hypothetical protein ACTH6A_09760 [Brachybacterium tyrofermentans]|uniref:hypothetical protein n=1 Tax=Brachybacterium tyrofermentans TaxID=47848 RepID=UPI003F8FF059